MSGRRLQLAHFPKWLRFVFAGFNALFVLYLFALVCIQLATLPTNEECNLVFTKEIWHGCSVPVPFCQNPFVARCDCASLEIVNGHNMSKLPTSFVNMISLRRVWINRGPLESLPTGMEALTRMADIDFDFNKLSEFNVDVSGWEEFVQLSVGYNNLNKIHPTLWKHATLNILYLNDNVGLRFPDSQLYLPSLRALLATNNSVPLPARFGPKQFPLLEQLYLSGNHIPVFPTNFQGLKDSLGMLGIARCNITI